MAAITPPQALVGIEPLSDDIKISPEAREILEKYSGIASDEVNPHVKKIRDNAFSIFPYPTIGQLHFLDFYFTAHPSYQNVISRLRNSQTLLDLGCCFGQDIRKMIYDGAPGVSITGLDIEAGFISLGYDLFLDSSTLASKFIVGDIFSLDLAAMKGTQDVVHASAFFHLFPREKQLQLVRILIVLLRPRAGSMVIGSHLGSSKPAEHPLRPGGATTFRHSVDSFRDLWLEAAEGDVGGQWLVAGSLDMTGMVGNEGMGWAEPDMKRLVFTVMRV